MKIIPFVFLLLALPLCLPAQEGYGKLIDDSKPAARQKNPAVITSKTLDVDGLANNAVFEGNVIVDDDDLTIHCDKMLIFIEEVADTSAQKGKKTAAEGSDPLSDFSGGSKGTKRQVNRIECVGNVLMIRKYTDENGKLMDDQRAKSDKAVYYVQEEKIVLNGKERPVIHRGEEVYSGSELVFFRNTKKITGKDIRVEYAYGTNKKSGPQDLFGGQKEPPKPPRTQF